MKSNQQLKQYVEDLQTGFPNACKMPRLNTKLQVVTDVINNNLNEYDIKERIYSIEKENDKIQKTIIESSSSMNLLHNMEKQYLNFVKIEALKYCLGD